MSLTAAPPFARGVWHVSGAAALCLIAISGGACTSSRAELFQPVRDAVQARAGLGVEWRTSPERSASGERKVRALQARPLSAQSAALIAVLSRADLQAAYAQLGLAGAALDGAGVPSNPEFEGNVTMALDGHGQPQLELSALEDVSGLISMISQSRAASAELAAARRRATATTLEVAAMAKRRFYEAVAAEQQLQLRRVLAQSAEAAAEFARALRAAGNIPEFELLRETVFDEEAQLALEQAITVAASSRETLAVELGVAPGTKLQLPEALEGLPDALPQQGDLERAALSSSLELEALRYSRQAADHGLGQAQLQSFLPHFGVGVMLKREDEWRLGPAVSLSLPLFDWGTAKRDAAHAKLEGLAQGYAAAQLRTQAAARDAALRIAAAHSRASRLKTRVLPLRAKLLDSAVQQYNAMTLDAFALLALRREQASAQERYVEALRDYWITRADVELLRAGAMPSQTAAMPSTERGEPSSSHRAAEGRGH